MARKAVPVETAVEVAGGDDSHSEGLVLLGLEAAVEDEDGLDVLLVDQVEHGALDVLPELAAAVVRAQAELAYFAT